MFKKENRVPSKQGVFYQLPLNKNNGPYLSKDIMYNNPKSNALLTNPDILNEHKRMAETLTRLQKTSQTQLSHDEKIENFNSILEFSEKELEKCRNVSMILRGEQGEFKLEMENLYEKVSLVSNQLLQHSMPVLKNLMKKVKESNQDDKAEYYKIQNQLRTVQKDQTSLKRLLNDCDYRIGRLEDGFGTENGYKTTSQSFLTSASTPHL